MKPTETWAKWEPHEEETRQDSWKEFEQHPDEQFRRWEGSRRWEVLVPVSKILSTFRKLFKRGKK